MAEPTDSDSDSERVLGMDRAITRRDFLNGVGVAIGGAMIGSRAAQAMGLGALQGAPYPPALTGLRGSHIGSYEVAHALRDGESWSDVRDTGERYDLVVVGGGISGLAAAYFYRRRFGADARVLVIDNHDDFGGHAKRNEFVHEGRTFIGYGGTQSLDSPSSFSPEVLGLLKELGIDVDRFYQAFDRELYASLGLSRSTFFDAETFGEDRLVPHPRGMSWTAFAERTPLSPEAQKDLVRLYEDAVDYLPGLDAAARTKALAGTSYLSFLRDHAKVHPQILTMFQKRTHSLFAMGIDGVPALDCWGLGYPGFAGMGAFPKDAPELSLTARPHEEQDPYIFHFPDGNASIARLLVRSLIPKSASGHTMEDIVTARMDYGKLDADGSAVRVRLGSTGIRVENVTDGVDVTYVRGGEAERVRAGRVVLGCWHAIIPHLCPELGQAQREALAYGPKVPLVYTNVFIRNWTAFANLDVSRVSATGGFHSGVSLDFPVSLGTYRHPRSPEEPIVLHLLRTPCSPGGSSRQQHAAGRHELLATPFETFERETRAQLGRIFGPGGFDPARDVLGITVNRWPNGYAYEYNSLWDPVFPPGEAPFELARKPFGRVHIANSDAQAYAYTHAAIDQAYRAVSEMS